MLALEIIARRRYYQLAGAAQRPLRVRKAGRVSLLSSLLSAGRACGRASTTPRSRPSAATSGRTGTGWATGSSPATRGLRRARPPLGGREELRLAVPLG